MTEQQILDGILDREREGTPPYVRAGDAGGRTSWGISERAHPEAWQPGPPTRTEASAIYARTYLAPWNPLRAVAPLLVVACVDDSVLSGVDAAIKRLQWVAGVPLDGRIGPLTVRAVQGWSERALLKRYTVERAVRVTRLVQRRPSDLVNLTGWVARILSFLP